MPDFYDLLQITRQDIIMRRREETRLPVRGRPAAPGHLLPYINLFDNLSLVHDEPKEKVNWMKEGF